MNDLNSFNSYNQNQQNYTNTQMNYNQNQSGYINNQANLNPDQSNYTNSQMNYNPNQVNYTNNPIGFYPNQPNRLSNPNNKKKIRVSFNSPVILSFTIICLVVLISEYLTGDITTYYLFSVYRSSLLDPLTYVRFFGHALGHADFEHYIGNMMYLLIIGPLLEEKYGSKSILLVMIVTAFVTGVFNYIFCPDVATLGASGIVFAFILLSSLTCMKEGSIPLTFILVAVLYLGEQVFEAMFVESNISNVSHIVGCICGCVLGYALNKVKIAIVRDNNQNISFTDDDNNKFTYY